MHETIVPNHEAMTRVAPDVEAFRTEHALEGGLDYLEAREHVEEARAAYSEIISSGPEGAHDSLTSEYVHDVADLDDPFGELPRALAIGAEELRAHPREAPFTAAELRDAPTQQLGEVLQDVALVDGEEVVEDIIEAIEHREAADTHAPAELELPEGIHERIREAFESSSFEQSPEVQEAITGYYEDHYKLGNVLEKIIENDTEGLSDTLIDESIQNSFLKETAKSLLGKDRQVTLQEIESIIANDLFRENAVAAETVSEDEQQYVRSLAAKLGEVAEAEGYAYAGVNQYDGKKYRMWNAIAGDFPYQRRGERGVLSPEKIQLEGERLKQEFWDDTRHAGQLEFHNTGNFGAISRLGFILRSRTRQMEVDGSYYSQMGSSHKEGGNMHSNLPHFSETYSYLDYKQQAASLKNGGGDSMHIPATAAVPLAEIIKVAPYARDAQYAEVRLKDTNDLDKVTVKDKVGVIGSQGSDYAGTHGEDRVFMADYRADHAAEASRYDIEFGFTGMVLMTESEHRAGFTFGHGYGYAAEVVIPDVNRQTGENEAQAQAIRDLQESSRNNPKYAGKVIAPLRRGVIEFVPEAEAIHHRVLSKKRIVTHAAKI